MQTRRFGRTELEMPVLSCGGMRYQQSWNAEDSFGSESQDNLEATVTRALELGINHVETARGYGTSEAQLGRLLPKLPRDQLILQTKVGPREDPRAFADELEDSFRRLQVDYLDLFAFHGLNTRERLEQTVRKGGCFEVAARLRDQGRIRHLGFSTHGPTALIEEAIGSGLFEYVNLHWYYIFQDNASAIDEASRRDMGVFIISPSDKGGMLYRPPAKLVELCSPLSPMVFNDVFCLANPKVHTISIGAARPTDFDEHLEALEHLPGGDSVLGPVVDRLESTYRAAFGDEYARTWRQGLPSWEDVPGGVNIRAILWLRNLAIAFDMLEYGRMRYKLLGEDHWFPGNAATDPDDGALASCLRHSRWADRIPGLLREAHELLRESAE